MIFGLFRAVVNAKGVGPLLAPPQAEQEPRCAGRRSCRRSLLSGVFRPRVRKDWQPQQVARMPKGIMVDVTKLSAPKAFGARGPNEEPTTDAYEDSTATSAQQTLFPPDGRLDLQPARPSGGNRV